MLAARRRCEELAPRRGQQAAPSPPDAVPDTEGPEQLTLEPETAPVKTPSVSLTLPEPLYAQDGILFFAQLPEELLRPMQSLLPILQDWLEEHPEGAAHEAMLELYFSLHDLMRTAGQYDTHYVTQLCARGSELELRLLCLDPSAFVDSCLSAGRAAALFSATLAPPSYYREVLGCANARAVARGTIQPELERESGSGPARMVAQGGEQAVPGERVRRRSAETPEIKLHGGPAQRSRSRTGRAES